MKEKLTDISIRYVDKHSSVSTKIHGSFDKIVLNIAKAKHGGGFFMLNGFAINPHYIITIEDITQKNK